MTRKAPSTRSAWIASLVVLGASSACAGELRFTDVTAASNIKVRDPNMVRVSAPNPHAVAVEDFDGDGQLDIIIASFGEPFLHYYRNTGNLRFMDVTRESGFESFRGAGTGAAVADFDHDGKLDIYLSSLRQGSSRLYRGSGGGKFADVSDKAGVLVESARSCAFSDVDGDGWCDLYVTCPKGPNRLFRNNRNGTFTDIASAAGVDQSDRHSLGCVFGDVDDDGKDDLFVSNYQSQLSTLFKNLGGGKFRDITAEAGVARKASAVGCVFADVFNRGRLDLYVTTDSWLAGANYTEDQLRKQGHTVEPNLLYENDGKGSFTISHGAMSEYKSLSHDAVLEDLDHDGSIDIYVGVDAESGNRFATSKGGNPLWQRSAARWQEAGQAWGVKHEANCVCVPAADFDNDGDLDLLLVNFYSNAVLYRNETNNKNWLRVKPVGTKSNPDGIGAQVRVFAGQKLIGFRHIQSGEGYCRSSAMEAHIGLGKTVARSYRVEVFFPATNVRVVRDNIEPGQRIVVREQD